MLVHEGDTDLSNIPYNGSLIEKVQYQIKHPSWSETPDRNERISTISAVIQHE